jgi:YD repeat-containing protein
LISYDLLNRVINKSSQEETINYEYDKDKIGTLSSIKANSFAVNYSYDNRYRKTSEEKTINSQTSNSTFAYDSMNRLVSEKLPNGKELAYNYNNQSNLKSITGFINSIDYNQLNQPILRNYANNLATYLTYNSSSFRLIGIKTEGKQDLNYEYDSAGNIVKINNILKNDSNNSEYDALDRLTKAKKIANNSYNLLYTYDSIGNILKIDSDNSIKSFIYSPKPAHSFVKMKTEANLAISSGLIAYYKFDNDTKDYSGNNNTGSLYGNAGWIDGIINKAVKFDGKDDYIIINNTGNSNYPFCFNPFAI